MEPTNSNRILRKLYFKYSNDTISGTFKKKKLLVEGRLDKFCFEKIVDSENVEVISPSFDLHILDLPNVRDVIIDFFKNGKPKVNFPLYEIYAVHDRDFVESEEIENVFVTDTPDLETLLLATKGFELTSLPDVDEEKSRGMIASSYQIAKVWTTIQNMVNEHNKGLPDYLRNKRQNIRDIFDDRKYRFNLDKFIDLDTGLDICKLFTYFTTEPGNMFFKDSAGSVSYRKRVEEALSEKGEMNIARKFKVNKENIDVEFGSHVWASIRGHDVFYLVQKFAPDPSHEKDHHLDEYISNHLNVDRLKNSEMIKNMAKCCLIA